MEKLDIARDAILDAIIRASEADEAGCVAQLTHSYHLLLCGGPMMEEFPDEIDREN